MADKHTSKSSSDKEHIWDKPRNVNILIAVLAFACFVVALADLFYVKKIHFEPETIFAAYGIYGFVCFAFIVFAGKLLRLIVMRDEDYYDK